MVGGDGADQISATVGNHTVVGDNAEFSYVAMGSTGAGKVLRYETTDTVAATGGNDVIVLGNGDTVALEALLAVGSDRRFIVDDKLFTMKYVTSPDFDIHNFSIIFGYLVDLIT